MHSTGPDVFSRLGEAGDNQTILRQTLEQLPAGAYTCDRAGHITYFNDRAAEMWGRSPALHNPRDKWCGSYELFTATGEKVSHDRCWMARAILEDNGFNGCEIIVKRPDGQRIAVLAYANPIRDRTGAVVGGVNVLVAGPSKKRDDDRAIVMLVEDHIDTAKSTERLLRMAGYRVEMVHTMADALALYQRETIDLVVSDIGLPDGTGHELMDRLREGGRPVRAVALSGYGTEKDLARSREAGFAEHIVKPVDWSRLKGALEKLVSAS